MRLLQEWNFRHGKGYPDAGSQFLGMPLTHSQKAQKSLKLLLPAATAEWRQRWLWRWQEQQPGKGQTARAFGRALL